MSEAMTEEPVALVETAAAPVETAAETVTPPAEPAPVEPAPAEPEVPPISVEDYGVTGAFGESLQAFAAQAKIPQESVDGLVAAYKQSTDETAQQQQLAMRAEGEAFVETWGEAKDDNLAIVRQSLKAVDTDGAVTKMLNESGYGNHPAILSMFLKIGNHLKEGGFLKSANNSPAAPLTAAQAMFGKTHPAG